MPKIKKKIKMDSDDNLMEVRKKCYNQLQTLLDRSSMYTNYVQSRMDEENEKIKLQKNSDENFIENFDYFQQPKLLSGGVLRDYQVDGFNWLLKLYFNGFNGILGDEMGLGKTIQCVSLVCGVIERGVIGPFLVAGPLSTITNWIREFKVFAPQIPCILYHGSKSERCNLLQKITDLHVISYKGKGDALVNCNVRCVVVTSYEMLMRDENTLSKFPWKLLIIDEGHRIKNMNCRLLQQLKKYQIQNKIILTGTPIQNSLTELWTLLNYLVPEIFYIDESFEEWFTVDYLEKVDNADEQILVHEERDHTLALMRQVLMPFMLKRNKDDVGLFLPPKKEVLVYVPFSKGQLVVYKTIVNRSLNLLEQPEVEDKIEVNEKGRPIRLVRKKSLDYRLLLGDDICDVEKPCNEDDFDDQYTDDVRKWVSEIFNQENCCISNCKKKKESLSLNTHNVFALLKRCCNHPYLVQSPEIILRHIEDNAEKYIDVNSLPNLFISTNQTDSNIIESNMKNSDIYQRVKEIYTNENDLVNNHLYGNIENLQQLNSFPLIDKYNHEGNLLFCKNLLNNLLDKIQIDFLQIKNEKLNECDNQICPDIMFSDYSNISFDSTSLEKGIFHANTIISEFPDKDMTNFKYIDNAQNSNLNIINCNLYNNPFIEVNNILEDEIKIPILSEINIIENNTDIDISDLNNNENIINNNNEFNLDEEKNEIDDLKLYNSNLISFSGKLSLLDRMLTLLNQDGHKVLIFSQSTQMLDIIEDYCNLKKYKFSRLDGTMKLLDRQQQIDRFDRSDVFIFLLSTRAGGLGINLIQADTVIIYDSDWNPQCDLQAQDRCHRIGQTKPVLVLRLVTKNSIDERIYERASAKRKLERMIIQKGKFKSSLKSLRAEFEPISRSELLNILKSDDAEKIADTDQYNISDQQLIQILHR